MQLWDIAGQERYGNLTRAYYKDAYGAFVVADASSRTMFEDLRLWKDDIDQKVLFPSDDDASTSPIPCILLAHKADLDTARIDAEELDEFCRKTGFVTWFATSAKTGQNIEEAAGFLVRHILQRVRESGVANLDADDVVSLGAHSNAGPANGGCAC
jgi:Ras-related protein Rab-32